MKPMKLLAPTLLICLTISLTAEARATKETSEKAKGGGSVKSSKSNGSNHNQMKAKLGTSFRFDGSSLHGKFQNSPSTTAMVEDDKFLDDLLGARKNFQDRMKKDQERN